MKLWCVVLFCALLLVQCSGKDPLSGARPVLDRITISGDTKIFFKGENFEFRAMGHFTNGAIQDISPSVWWKSMNNNVASFEDSAIGIATFDSIGNVKIMVRTRTEVGKEGKIIESELNIFVPKQKNESVGTFPHDMVTTFDSKYVLVTDKGSNRLFQLKLPENIRDYEQLQIDTKNIELANNPREIVLSSQSKCAFVLSHVNQQEFTLTQLDLPLPSTPSRTWTFSSLPTSIFSDDAMDSLFIAIESAKKVYVVSCDLDTTLLTYGGGPRLVGIKRGTGKLIIIHPGIFPIPPKILLYDLQNSEIDTIEVGFDFNNPLPIVPHPGFFKKAYLPLESKLIYRLSLSESPEVYPISLESVYRNMVITNDNSRAYVVETYYVEILDNIQDKILGEKIPKSSNSSVIPGYDMPLGIAVRTDTAVAYLIAKDLEGDHHVFKVDLNENKLVRAVPVNSNLQKIVITKNNLWLVMLSKEENGLLSILPAF